MKSLEQQLSEQFSRGNAPLDPRFPIEQYVSLDLSATNPAIQGLEISDPGVCQAYIEEVLQESEGSVAYGGYLEKRKLYDSPRFVQRASYMRDVHLGVDFWAPAGTTVHAPVAGKLHSFANNTDPGNYGPTLILEHPMANGVLYTLYGHLAVESLQGKSAGMSFQAGDILATLGEVAVNGGYAPHLHFQLILDLQGFSGDYPGVCADHEVDFFKNNCPDPNLLLQI